MRCIPPVVVCVDGRNFKNTLSTLGFKKLMIKLLPEYWQILLDFLLRKVV